MHLYNLTLQRPTAVTQAVVGNFSGGKHQDILLSHGTCLELFRLDAQTGKLHSIIKEDTFGSVRSLASFRLTGNTKDYVVVGSDSGSIVILEYDQQKGEFKKLHQETFGKSGARRTVPGQFLATDPQGRCVMIAAVEKSKLVYILNRDASSGLTISSPLEAHKANTIIHSIVGVDVGFENPIFAVLEVDYTESDQDPSGVAYEDTEKILAFYELDLGLNHVVRKWSEATDRRANLLVQVPGGQSSHDSSLDGPSGVLVCCENHIIYQKPGHISHRVPIPRRQNKHSSEEADGNIIIVAAVMHRMKGSFFFLLQDEDGNIFKVTLEHVREDVTSLKIKYFDTVPPSTNLCILKSGFLFAATEFGDQHLYQFQKLGDDDNEPEWKSASFPQFGMTERKAPLPAVYFRPRPLENLILVDILPSLDPILDSKVMNTLSDGPQVLLACGKGPRSTLRTLHHGLQVEEKVTSELPNLMQPTAVWSTKTADDEPYDTLLILSFFNGTLVLSIGEELEEVRETSFLTSVPTLAVQQIGTNSLLQVHSKGIRHIHGRTSEWSAPSGESIVCAATNKRQVVVALTSAEIVYFELDDEDQLNEYQEKKAMGSTVLSLSIGVIPEGRLRAKYVAVGCEDQTVRILSLDLENTLETVSLQAVTAPPTSICMLDMLDASLNKALPTTFVNIGLQNGLLLRSVLDPLTGRLTDTRTRFLGALPVRLFAIQLQKTPALLALSSRMWLTYTYGKTHHCTPLSYEKVQCAYFFSGSVCPEGIIGFSGGVMCIFAIPRLGETMKEETLPLTYTPRKMISHPVENLVYVIESDHRVYGLHANQSRSKESEEHSDDAVLPVEVFGHPKAPAGNWGSVIRIVDPTSRETVGVYHLEGNEAAFSLAFVPFSARDSELHLVVGTAANAVVSPRSCSSGYLRTYKVTQDGKFLELLHKTEVDDIPLSLSAFQGRLLAGIGNALRIYEIGQKKLLRKAENKTSTTAIVSLASQGSRIVVGDMQESTQFVQYKPDNHLITFADDTQPRWISAMTMVDYMTVAAADRFGNIFLNRVDSKVSQEVDDSTGAGIISREKGGAPHKTKLLAHFHVGDLVTSIQKVSLLPGAPEALLYTGLHGTIGVLIPLTSKDDIEFLSTLEQHLRTEQISLVGRDHLSWRGYYVPVKAVVDGDLCEAYGRLEGAKQQSIAAELDRTVGEVLRKLEQLRVMNSGF